MKGWLTAAGVIFVAGLLAPLIAPHPPSGLFEERVLLSPGPAHWMGTDELGRDLLSRVLYGARVSIAVGLIGAAATLLLGGLAGILAGLAGRDASEWSLRGIDLFISIPELLIVVLLAQILGSSVWGVGAAIGLVSWPKVARLFHGETRKLRHEAFVESARVAGAGTSRVVFRHLLPNLRSTAIVVFSLLVASSMLTESVLSFIGLGINDPFDPWGTSWGTLASAGWRAIRGYPHLFFFPSAAVALTVFVMNSLGESFRRHLEHRERRAG